MGGIRNKKWLPVLMALTILGITAFQIYWLQKTYEREAKTLDIRSNITFRETIFSLQAAKLKLDQITADSNRLQMHIGRRHGDTAKITRGPQQKIANLVNVLIQKAKGRSGEHKTAFEDRRGSDTDRFENRSLIWRRERLMQFLYDVDSMQEPIKVEELDTAFSRRMQEQNIEVPFTIKRIKSDFHSDPPRNEVTLGFSHPVTYKLHLGNTFPYLIKRILAVILLSVFLVAFTTLSFMLLYNNLLRQRRLADIKNEFISNITHELKTPIATVSVAIEALRSFNGSLGAERTKEYLDISANELQRLSLLVDKVLKLSMFEKKEVELRYERLDMKELMNEVTASMRLQFEKHGADVSVHTEGDTTLEGDRLHLVSVLFNLMDNALKYSNGSPKITINIIGNHHKVTLCMADTGIGIPAEYKDKVFDKFFRVPTGNVHNAKGYGLGLSYVAHVIRKHQGTIKVESIEGNGSKFVIVLPKQHA